ncbi:MULTISPECIES: PucR family transcriptional regulator [unclassified Crossiella]|uniref:PucR family transcriptional regulator n=1 Tax=unclassified Crossiella TaxID=2620835 RepID=UPI001FFEBC57|nr:MULTISPECIES: PucR family transcriptional regulator [unclassified Crossiella]MCK2237102.1 PucR family transcriptional regulator [Crossiella sp. S99.2]MCK2250770.1 PucR family transcriptional regulator [Crossiella sp. S99.1]
MPLTLRALLELPDLGLRLLAGEPGLDRPLPWAHVSELADPTPFLEGGELLLSTGLALPRGARERRSYLDRLAAAGAAGLAFGTGLSHQQVPAELVKAARARDFPLLEVPRATPFIAVTKAVSRSLAADSHAEATRMSGALQALAGAATGVDGLGAVLRRLARELDAWVVLLDVAGEPLRAAPASARGRVAGAAELLDRLRAARPPAAVTVQADGERVTAQALGAGRRTRAFLLLGSARAWTVAEQHLLGAAASLLALALAQTGGLDSAARRLRAGLFELLAAGQRDLVAEVVRPLWGALPAPPLRVLALTGAAPARTAAADLLSAQGMAEPCFFAEVEDQVLVLAESPALLAWCRELPARVPGLTLGISDPVTEVAEGHRQALAAADAARRHGRVVLKFADLAGSGLLGLLDPRRAAAFAEALLSPLSTHDATGRGDLLTSLRAWLGHHGQWDPAAQQLGVHRHTLRNRMRRVADLLGKDLESPGIRAELWLALHLHRPD